MITAFGSGTQACTVTTEHFVSSPNVQGNFRAVLDLNDMAANDVVEIRVYKIVLTGGTSRVVFFHSFAGVQPANALIAITDEIWNELTDTNAVRFSIKQTFGVSCDIPWVVLKDDALTPATSGRTAVVDGNGLIDANAVKVGPTGAGTAQTAGDIMADTNDIQTRLPAALVSGRMDSSVGAVAAGVDLSATMKASVNAEVDTALATAIPDSYSADGAQPTANQALLEIRQQLQEQAISGTTGTVKKPDGATTALTLTYNSATDPTSVTRAT